jgi:hypothetical protein
MDGGTSGARRGQIGAGQQLPTHSGPEAGITCWIEADAPLVGADVVL